MKSVRQQFTILLGEVEGDTLLGLLKGALTTGLRGCAPDVAIGALAHRFHKMLMFVKSEQPDDVKSKKPYIQLAQAAYSLGADLTEPTRPWDTVRSAMRTLPPHAELPAESDETLIHAIYNHGSREASRSVRPH